MTRYAFARTSRLLDSADFGKVFRSRAKSIDASLVVLARPNGLTFARLGLAVAKKHIRRSVDRNRIKRIIRESFRMHQDKLNGVDLVVVSRASALKQSNTELFNALRKHWTRSFDRCKNS